MLSEAVDFTLRSQFGSPPGSDHARWFSVSMLKSRLCYSLCDGIDHCLLIRITAWLIGDNPPLWSRPVHGSVDVDIPAADVPTMTFGPNCVYIVRWIDCLDPELLVLGVSIFTVE